MKDKHYKVIGHYPTMQNGLPSYVIVEFMVTTLTEAKKLIEDRKYTYTDLRIE